MVIFSGFPPAIFNSGDRELPYTATSKFKSLSNRRDLGIYALRRAREWRDSELQGSPAYGKISGCGGAGPWFTRMIGD